LALGRLRVLPVGAIAAFQLVVIHRRHDPGRRRFLSAALGLLSLVFKAMVTKLSRFISIGGVS
jgi:hypothetical protein